MQDNLERQLAELEALEAIYPDELTVNTTCVEIVKKFVEGPKGIDATELPALSCTIILGKLARLECGKLEWAYPSAIFDFSTQYPQSSPPTVAIDGLTFELTSTIESCFEENAGEECTMQLVMSLNERIEIENEKTVQEHAEGVKKQEEVKRQAEETKNIFEASQQEALDAAQALAVPVLGRRVINSPYILKPAKIKDIKKCADELKLGGYAKVGKPGIIVIEGPEAGCKKYCPMLQNLGWKHQTEQGAEQKEGEAGESIDKLRALPSDFKVLGEDSISELSQLCRDAGLTELFFTSLNIHNSMSDGGDDSQASKAKDRARKKGGKKR
jgi:hypothetical protein